MGPTMRFICLVQLYLPAVEFYLVHHGTIITQVDLWSSCRVLLLPGVASRATGRCSAAARPAGEGAAPRLAEAGARLAEAAGVRLVVEDRTAGDVARAGVVQAQPLEARGGSSRSLSRAHGVAMRVAAAALHLVEGVAEAIPTQRSAATRVAPALRQTGVRALHLAAPSSAAARAGKVRAKVADRLLGAAAAARAAAVVGGVAPARVVARAAARGA